MKVLIIEDDKFLAQLMEELLRDNGFGCEVANTVQGALKKNMANFDVFIIDVMLPNDPAQSGIPDQETRAGYLAGIALARKIREQLPAAKIILTSQGTENNEAEKWSLQQNIPFIYKSDGSQALFGAMERIGALSELPSPKAFIVHGHDEKSLRELKKFITGELHWQEPIVLREQPNRGKTIIEKFEECAYRIDWVFILMTPDDKAISIRTNDEKRRARQNVIFELGFFYGQFGRKSGRVIVLTKGAVELPTDIQGIVWIDITAGIESAGEQIKAEVTRTSCVE